MGTKLTIEEVQERVQNVGWELLTKVYINSKKQLDLKCDKGHEFSKKFNIPNLEYNKRADERSWSEMQRFFKRVFN